MSNYACLASMHKASTMLTVQNSESSIKLQWHCNFVKVLQYIYIYASF
jgi:hypothetical protein